MPSMNEIYDEHALAYDELVSREDWQGNLASFLAANFDFAGKTVIEPGAGTGRLTALYVGQAAHVHLLDRSVHMLEQAKANLAPWSPKLECTVLDNLQLDTLAERADYVVEGWSFGHVVVENRDDLPGTVDRLVAACRSLLNPGGRLILVESLGTGTSQPEAPGASLAAFYERLEQQHGFTKAVLSTDYQFSSVAEAARVMGFFFGPGMEQSIRASGVPLVREFTGVWYTAQ